MGLPNEYEYKKLYLISRDHYSLPRRSV